MWRSHLRAEEHVGIPPERDFATDSSAAGIKGQAERGRGNGESTEQQTRLSVPSGFGQDNDSPQTAARAGAGLAARMMMMQGGARRAASSPGQSVTREIPFIHALDKPRFFLSSLPWLWGAEGLLATVEKGRPRSSSPARRCSLASPRRVPFPPVGVEGGLGPWKEEFRNKQRQFLLLLVECQRLWSPAPLSTNRLTNAPSASAKTTSMKASITQHSLHTTSSPFSF